MIYRIYLLEADGHRFIEEMKSEEWQLVSAGERFSSPIDGKQELCEVVSVSQPQPMMNMPGMTSQDVLVRIIGDPTQAN